MHLTAKAAQHAPVGWHCDGRGLYLQVTAGTNGFCRSWVFRYTAGGRERYMGLGPLADVTLAMAREKALEARRLRLEGVDPIDARRAAKAQKQVEAAKSKTFQECAEEFMRDNAREWTNGKHALEWRSTLARYAYPVIGSLPVATIDTPLVLKIVKPLWERVPTTAKRLLGRIENVLGWATVHHYRHGDNPAAWSGLIEHALPAVEKGAHHAALPFVELPSFMTKLRQDCSVGSAALQFIVLTAVRMGEAINATWDEVNLAERVWTVPAARMKGGREHRVPLSDAAVAILESMSAIKHSQYVFPGTKYRDRAIGENTVWRLAKDIAGDETVTVHGFRSAFRDWAAERTNFPREVAEMALAHAIPSAVEAAYRRGDLFVKRAKLMDAWGEYCGKPPIYPTVIPLRKVY
jgi:integrase